MNPLLPSLETYSTLYLEAAKYPRISSIKIPTLGQQYSFVPEVESALKSQWEMLVFSKMSNILIEDENDMYLLIGLMGHTKAYLYVAPSINTPEFREKILLENPMVYGLMSKEHRMDPRMMIACEQGMRRQMGRVMSYESAKERPYPYKLHEDIDPKIIFSPDAYKKIYATMLLRNPEQRYNKHACRAIGPNADYPRKYDRYIHDERVAFIATARVLNPELADQYDRVEREAIVENMQAIARRIYEEIDKRHAEYLLDAVAIRVPKAVIELQKGERPYWERLAQEYFELQSKRRDEKGLNADETKRFERLKDLAENKDIGFGDVVAELKSAERFISMVNQIDELEIGDR